MIDTLDKKIRDRASSALRAELSRQFDRVRDLVPRRPEEPRSHYAAPIIRDPIELEVTVYSPEHRAHVKGKQVFSCRELLDQMQYMVFEKLRPDIEQKAVDKFLADYDKLTHDLGDSDV